MTETLTQSRQVRSIYKPSEKQLAEYERDGYYVARSLFSESEVDKIREAFMHQASLGRVDGLFDPIPNAADNDPLARYPRMMHPHRWEDLEVGRIALRYLLDKRIEIVLSALLGEQPLAAQSMFYYKPAGARGQALHQDNFYLRVAPGTCMAAWTAIDEANEENGGLMVVPGSHKAAVACPQMADTSVSFTTEYVPPPVGIEPIPIKLAPGDVLFFNGSVIHGSYPNTSPDKFRRALICHYIPESSLEVSRNYNPLIRFNDGNTMEIAYASGGGPCGTLAPEPAPH